MLKKVYAERKENKFQIWGHYPGNCAKVRVAIKRLDRKENGYYFTRSGSKYDLALFDNADDFFDPLDIFDSWEEYHESNF